MKRAHATPTGEDTKRSCQASTKAAEEVVSSPADGAVSPDMRVLLLAGGTDGIGLAFLEVALQSNRYSHIYVLGRKFQRVRELRASHSEGLTVEVNELLCDITDDDVLRKTISGLPPIDDFVNTIGTFTKGLVATISFASIEEHFALNTVANIKLTQAVLPKFRAGRAQMLVCSATLAVQARSPYALQSATKAGYKFFVDALRVELKGRVRVMTLLPPSVNTQIFSKAGDDRDTSQYPPPERVADVMELMLKLPADICVPEMVIEQHLYQQAT